MYILVSLIGKLIIYVLRLRGGSGSALPGLIVERLYPNFLAMAMQQVEQGVIVISGTNGKTTTTKAAVTLLEAQGLRVFTNDTGSNFTRGIVSHVLQDSNWRGQLQADIAVLELDEAFSRHFVKKVTPRGVLLLNVMRDQLDRYGEIDTTAKFLAETAAAASDFVICNYNDARLARIADELSVPITYFAVSDELRAQLPTDEELYGTQSAAVFTPKTEPEVILESFASGVATVLLGGKQHEVQMQLAGLHNAQNSVAAAALVAGLSASSSVSLSPEQAVVDLVNVQTAWGRGEVIYDAVNGTRYVLSLVKNPAGFRQSLASYSTNSDDAAMAFFINDKYADGRDISWLWDVSFTTLNQHLKLYVSGSRAYDMALRLQYDEHTEQIVDTDIMQVLQQVRSNSHNEVILHCTYTAMLQVRKWLLAETGSSNTEGLR